MWRVGSVSRIRVALEALSTGVLPVDYCRLVPPLPTIFDVARSAGVGVGTVSRVLNDSPLVADHTRQRVLEAMERLNYRPSATARAFGRRHTATLELIVPLYTRSLFLETIRGFEEALAATSYTLSIRTVATPEDRARALDQAGRSSDADGAVLVWLTPTQDFAERVAAQHFPTVLLNAQHPRLWGVAVNHDLAATNAVSYCIGLGHQRIGLVDRLEDPFNYSGAGICRFGYDDTIEAAGLPTPLSYADTWHMSATGGGEAANKLLNLPEPPTAVVVGSDVQALGFVERARAMGLRVPQDVSVVGYNDNDLAAYFGLTTIQVPVLDMARAAAQLLLDVVAQPDAQPTTSYLPTQLVRRRTCGPPPPDRATPLSR
jgi:DNA-binding LacI/PurR family transcriptional regulator